MTKPRIAVAGRKTMGGPLLQRLKHEEYPITFSCNATDLWLNDYSRLTMGGNLRSANEIGKALDQYIDGVDVMFLAIPSNEHERPIIEYCLDHNVYPILFCKHYLASHYDLLHARKQRHMVGASATVGGRTQSLSWLRSQHLDRKKFVLYAYWNASTNFYMHGAAAGGSARGMFQKAKAFQLAEPGSDDYVQFLNAEIGGDYRYKVSIAMNDAMLGDGPFMTPQKFDPYVPLTAKDVRRLTLPTHNDRFIIRIANVELDDEFERGAPGSLNATFGDFSVHGGFFDLGRKTSLGDWVKEGEFNGVQIRFEDGFSDEGTVQLAGLGAGPATVGAAMNDLYEYEKARSGTLLEAKWPRAA